MSKAAYRDYLGKLELQYGKLQVSYIKDTEAQKRLVVTTPSIFQRSHGGSVKSKQIKKMALRMYHDIFVICFLAERL